MTKTRLTVAMWPHRSNFDLNPYTALLALGLERRNVEVIEFGWDRRSFGADIVHFHWPNEFFNLPRMRLRIRVWKELLWLAAFRAKGGHLVWTVHNVWPHDRPKQYSLQLRAFLRLVDGVIFLNHTSRDAASTEHRALVGKNCTITPLITNDDLFSIPANNKEYTHDRSVNLGFFGLIRPYKQLDRLIHCMKEISAAEASLAISGASFGYPHIERQLKDIALDASNIKLSFSYLTHAQLEQFADECDAVILPYRNILNSGAAIFALSRLRPVMVPDLGGMLELKRTVGDDWVFCYSGELTSGKIREFLTWLRVTPRRSPPDMSSFSPETVAATTAQFYNSLSA